MKNKIVMASFLIWATYSLQAQTVLMNVDTETDTLQSEQGRNLTHFSHLYMGVGFVGGETVSGAPVDHLTSGYFSFGHRYKRKFNEVLSAGFELAYSRRVYAFDKDGYKTIPDTVHHDTERLIFQDAGLGVYFRINYGKRGNFVGKFMDLGGQFNWTLSMNHRTRDKHADGSILKANRLKLGLQNPFNYGAFVRLGFNRMVLVGHYRLSYQFKRSANMPELPEFLFGLQFGFH